MRATSERVLRGIPAAEGRAEGLVTVHGDVAAMPSNGSQVDGTVDDALEALRQVGEELAAAADQLRALGWPEEAEVLDTNRLMASDPTLVTRTSALAVELGAAAAVVEACEEQASKLSAIDDPLLAARADDVRQIGRRAVKLLGRQRLATPTGSILVAAELGPADVADLLGTSIRGIALASGSVASHAAIVARGIGLPMVVGLGDELMDASDGDRILLDGGAGVAVLHPAAGTRTSFRHPVGSDSTGRGPTSAPGSEALDVHQPTLRCNASTLAEIEAGLAAGAAGVGLLRTEIAFLDATSWPSEAASVLALAPLLTALHGHTATVRLFDFGDDKTPPFLRDRAERGVALLLQHPDECSGQLRAILRCGLGPTLRLLVPMVETAEQLATVRDLVTTCLEACGPAITSRPPIGAMIESPGAVSRIDEIVAVADFVSIGTNDLAATTLGLVRRDPAWSAAATADPAVIDQVARVVEVAGQASIGVSVCGEAAAVPEIARTFAGLGVNELSVAPSRLTAVRQALRRRSDRPIVAGTEKGDLVR